MFVSLMCILFILIYCKRVGSKDYYEEVPVPMDTDVDAVHDDGERVSPVSNTFFVDVIGLSQVGEDYRGAPQMREKR